MLKYSPTVQKKWGEIQMANRNDWIIHQEQHSIGTQYQRRCCIKWGNWEFKKTFYNSERNRILERHFDESKSRQQTNSKTNEKLTTFMLMTSKQHRTQTSFTCKWFEITHEGDAEFLPSPTFTFWLLICCRLEFCNPISNFTFSEDTKRLSSII